MAFYPINNDFALEQFNSSRKKIDFNSHILFRSFVAFNNEKVFEFSPEDDIPYAFNNVRISFLLSNEDGVQYQYLLENYSKGWTSWNAKNTAEFVGLREGNYILKVKAKKGEQITEIQEIKFGINPPLYPSFWSYLLYLLFLVGLYFLVEKYQQNKLRRQKFEMLKKEPFESRQKNIARY